MIRKLLFSLILLLVIVGGVVFFYFDSIIKSGIEVVGSQVLGTSVTVSSVSVSPLGGSGSIRGLNIANPPGYQSDNAFQLGEVEVILNVGSVFSDVIEIESVRIVQPDITYETRITTDNIRSLMQNLPSAGSSEAESGGEGSSKQLIIRDFQILDPQLNLVTAIATAPVPLADIHLTDIGTGGDSVSVAEVMRRVLSSLSTSIVNANLPSVDELRRQVEGRVQDSVNDAGTAVEEAVDGAVEDLGGRLRSILN